MPGRTLTPLLDMARSQFAAEAGLLFVLPILAGISWHIHKIMLAFIAGIDLCSAQP